MEKGGILHYVAVHIDGTTEAAAAAALLRRGGLTAKVI
jgi:hypothetical protein